MSGRDGGPTDAHAWGRFVCSPCRDEAMLQDILRFDNHFLARAAQMTDEEVVLRFRQCPTAFYCILETVGDSTFIRGYFVILPLTGACVAAIRRGDVTAGKQIRPSDLAASNQPSEGAYLSVVCAVGARARAALIAAGVQAVRSLFRDRGIRFLFARAATPEGARMLARLTEQKFAPDGAIHEIDISRYSVITSSE